MHAPGSPGERIPPPAGSFRKRHVFADLCKDFRQTPSSSFFLGGRDIHYKDAMKETTSVCEGHPQQKPHLLPRRNAKYVLEMLQRRPLSSPTANSAKQVG